MKRTKFLLWVFCSIFAWFSLYINIAHAGTIASNPLGLNVSIYSNRYNTDCTSRSADTTYYDVTDCWLPEPNEEVYIVFDPPISSIEIDPITSNHRGMCTNYDGVLIDPDFYLNNAVQSIQTPAGAKQGYQLIPYDCGGKAVIKANINYYVTLPKDTDADGLPDIWESKYGFFPDRDTFPDGKTDGEYDAEISSGSNVTGDGTPAQDEYRGFMVGGRHIRTSPNKKDLFVNIVKSDSLPSGTCKGTSLIDSHFPFTHPRYTTLSVVALYDNLNSLLSSDVFHYINESEWIDSFYNYDVSQGISYDGDPNMDRVINSNRIIQSGTEHRGVRVIECLDTTASDASTTMGWGAWGTPDLISQSDGNAIIYTQRIKNYIVNAVTAGQTRSLKYYKYNYSTTGNAWTLTQNFGNSPYTPTEDDKKFLTAKTLQYYAAMEVGHIVYLTPTVEGTRSESYGHHHATNTGSNMDQRIQITKSKSTSGDNAFYIPSIYNTSDTVGFDFNGSN